MHKNEAATTEPTVEVTVHSQPAPSMPIFCTKKVMTILTKRLARTVRRKISVASGMSWLKRRQATEKLPMAVISLISTAQISKARTPPMTAHRMRKKMGVVANARPTTRAI